MPSQENLSKNSKAMFKAMALALQPTTKALSTQTAILNRIALTSEKQTAEEAFKDNKARKVGQENEKKQTGFLKGIFEKGKKNTGILGFLGKHWGKILIGLTLLLTPMSKLVKGFKWLKDFWTKNTITQMGKWLGGAILTAWGIKTAVGLTLESLLKALFFKKMTKPSVPTKIVNTRTPGRFDPPDPLKKPPATATKQTTPKRFKTKIANIGKKGFGLLKKLGAPLVIGAGLWGALKDEDELAEIEKAGLSAKQFANMKSREPLSTAGTKAMEQNARIGAKTARDLGAGTLGFLGDVASVLGSGVSLATDGKYGEKWGDTWGSAAATKMIDSGAKKFGDAYVEAAKKTIKAVKNFTKKEIEDTKKPLVSSDPVVRRLLKQQGKNEEKKEKSFFDNLGNTLGEWGDKQYKKYVEPAVQAADRLQRVSTDPITRGAQGRIAPDSSVRYKTQKIAKNMQIAMAVNSDLAEVVHMSGAAFKAMGIDAGVNVTSGFRNRAAQARVMENMRKRVSKDGKKTGLLQYAKNYMGYNRAKSDEERQKILDSVNDSSTEQWLQKHFSKHQSGNAFDVSYPQGVKGNKAKQAEFVDSLDRRLKATHPKASAHNEDDHIHINTGGASTLGSTKDFEKKFNLKAITAGEKFTQGYNVTPPGMGPGTPANTIIIKQGDNNSSSSPLTIAHQASGTDSNAEKLSNTL